VALSVIFGVVHAFAVIVIAVSAGVGGYLRRWLARKSHNPLLQPFCAALLAGAVAALALYLGPGEPQRLVAVCPCMVLVPGPHILNGALDLARVRVPLGAARIGYAALIILMICAGLLLGLSFGEVTLPVWGPSVPVPLVFDVLDAGVAVAAFGTFFAMPARMLPLPVLVGMLAHGARWASISVAGARVEVAALLACLIVSVVIRLGSGAHARRVHFPNGGRLRTTHRSRGGNTSRRGIGHTCRWRDCISHHARHGVRPDSPQALFRAIFPALTGRGARESCTRCGWRNGRLRKESARAPGPLAPNRR
jgi:uncharacterized membrane protein YjjB (DUF3815 family)